MNTTTLSEMADKIRHLVFVLYKCCLRDNPMFRRVFQSRRVRVVPFGILSGWRICSALSDGLWMSLGLYERDGQRWLKNHLRGGSGFIAVDAGSYLGFYSLVIARLLQQRGGGVVYAFDPNPSNIARVEQAVAANHANIVPQCKALGSHSGFVMGSCEGDVSMVRLDDSAASQDQSQRFEIVSLDSLLDSGFLPHVDFIKVDVDGFEAELLQGAQRLLAKCHPQILIELHTQQLALTVHDLLAAHGYSFSDLRGRKVTRDLLATAHMAFDMWCQPPSKGTANHAS